MCVCVSDETPWLLSDPDSEAQLGCRLNESMERSRRRQMLGPEAALFAGLEFWLSPRACHREMCIELIKTCGGIVRLKRPTQKMALLSQPKQLIICHEDDSHVASYLMRIKTGNKGVFRPLFLFACLLCHKFHSTQITSDSKLESTVIVNICPISASR